jgi:hypothetical protein
VIREGKRGVRDTYPDSVIHFLILRRPTTSSSLGHSSSLPKMDAAASSQMFINTKLSGVLIFIYCLFNDVNRGSVVGIATGYRLDD